MDVLLSDIINGNDDNSNACMLNPITTHMQVMNILVSIGTFSTGIVIEK